MAVLEIVRIASAADRLRDLKLGLSRIHTNSHGCATPLVEQTLPAQT